jgi:hypothetical protein
MSRYVEKIRLPVRLARLGAAPESGTIALAPRAELHDGPETLLERLNADLRVVPFLLPGSDTVLLVMRRHIEWVDADDDAGGLLVRPATYRATSEEDVQVRMAGGDVFEGVLAIEMPDEFNRASDYLNGEEPFFPVRMRGLTRLVNKLRVVDVRVRGAVTTPRAA